jgi:uncharacterized membrane protein
MASERIHASQSRLGFLDWTRGIGAFIMLQGHVFHSFTAKEHREGSWFVLSQFVGGMPPAFFLFLTGVTLGFLMDSLSRKEPSVGARIFAALKRARYLLIIAVLFRLQMWLFAWPYAPWTDILRVDVLNCMAFTVAALSWLTIFDTRQRVIYGFAAGAIIAALSPVVSSADLSLLPDLLRQYLVPSPEFFPLFPWGAFLAFGVSAGSVIRLVPSEEYSRMMQWAALLSLVTIAAANYLSAIPYSLYEKSDFWLNSPGLIFIKLAVVVLTGAVGYLWMTFQTGRWSWVATLGQHSLPVYWLHIELVYGRWFGYWKERLNVAETVAGAVALIFLMVWVAEWKGRYDRGELPWLRGQIGRLWPEGA